MIERLCKKIHAQGADGEEHHLEVLKHPSGLITIRDAEISRVMVRSVALELCLQLVYCIDDEPAPDRTDLIEGSDMKNIEGAGAVPLCFGRSTRGNN